MRILNILPYSPFPPHFGGALRVAHLLRAMASRHEVSIIAFGSTEAGGRIAAAIPPLRSVTMVPPTSQLNGLRKRVGQAWAIASGQSGIGLIYRSAAMQSAITEALMRERFDVIQFENYPMGAYDLDGAEGAIRVLDAQNVEYDSADRVAKNTSSPLRRWFYEREAKTTRREEISIYRNQDALFVTSERDADLLAEITGVPKFVIPNGVDLTYFVKTPVPVRPNSLVFTGTMNYYPNQDGALYFLQEIFPRILRELPDATIAVVGNSPPKKLLSYRAPNVEITGHVPDVRPFIDRSAVYVVPLRMGGGTRLKVMEALAMKKPVVTTSIGCEGIHVRHGESVVIADHPDEFAASVVELLRNPQKAALLAEVGHQTVRKDYSWDAVGDKLEAAYGAILQKAPAGPPVRLTGTGRK